MWVQVGWLILGLGSSTFTLKIIWMIHNYIGEIKMNEKNIIVISKWLKYDEIEN